MFEIKSRLDQKLTLIVAFYCVGVVEEFFYYSKLTFIVVYNTMVFS